MDGDYGDSDEESELAAPPWKVSKVAAYKSRRKSGF